MASWEILTAQRIMRFKVMGASTQLPHPPQNSQTALKSQERVDVLKDLFVLLLGYNLLISSCKDHYGVREITSEKYVTTSSMRVHAKNPDPSKAWLF